MNISHKLHRSERLAFIGKLSGSITHELRNPLAVLKNAAYYLSTKLKTVKDKDLHKYIDMIRQQIKIVDSIVDDIMGSDDTGEMNIGGTVDGGELGGIESITSEGVRIASTLKEAIATITYYFRVSKIKYNLKTVSQEVKEYGKGYERII